MNNSAQAAWKPFLVYVITDVAGVAAAGRLRPSERLAVQLRDSAAGGAAMWQAAVALRRAGHRVYVNDRVDIAVAAGCEGVHLPATSFSVAEARAVRNQGMMVGVSAHSVLDVAHARERGADFCVLSPIFASPGKGEPLGTAVLEEAAGLGIAVYALGGVHTDNAEQCLSAGATGVAAIRSGLALARALVP